MSETHLVVQEPLLHPVVGADVLQDIPRKLLVELPRDEAHAARDSSDNAGNRNQEPAYIVPHRLRRLRLLEPVVPLQDVDGLPDLVDLDGCVDEHGDVGNRHADDLNRVLHAQGVPHHHHLVQEAEDEERQEGRDRLVLGVGLGLPDVRGQADLEAAEDVPAAG